MAKVGLIIKPGIAKAVSFGHQVAKWVETHGHELLLEEETSYILSSPELGTSAEILVNHSELVVVLGGDGTLIGVARYISGNGPTLLGVNFGHLGFLTEITPVELIPTIEAVFAKKATFAERRMIQVQVLRRNSCVFEAQGLNDMVVQKGARDRLLEMDLAVEGEEVMRLRADGIIVATPTGSTAYSLAAGGSIVFPSLAAVMVTPICPHSLTIRPLILPMTANLTVTIPEYDGKVFATVDGQVSEALYTGDVVKVSQAKHIARFVRSPSRSYFEILRTKLNWGIANKTEN